MKIIKHGKAKPTEYTGTCRKCGCVFTATKAEVQWIEDRPWDGCYVAKCPERGCTETVVYMKEINNLRV